MRLASLLAVAAATVGSAVAQNNDFVLGFNVGASDDTGKAKSQADFEREFRTARTLQGAPGNFTAVRLYSNIQWGTERSPQPIAAFPAAIATNTRLLLGIWASGTNSIDSELSTLLNAVEEYGSRLTDLVIGISVGSEDLYRVSESGIRNKAGVGNGADTIVRFIRDARRRLANTPLANVPLTHVDTWTAWVNTSNSAVIDNIDFVAVNAFPFYESERENTIANAGTLLSSALSATEGVAKGKDVWITETGWAYTGPDFGAADASVENAARYWKDVGCALFGRRNVFWYTLRDANPENKVKFAITDNLSTRPRYDISCPTRVQLPPASGNSSIPVIPSGSARPSSSGSASSGSTGGSALGASVSVVNTMAMAISVIFVVAAFAL